MFPKSTTLNVDLLEIESTICTKRNCIMSEFFSISFFFLFSILTRYKQCSEFEVAINFVLADSQQVMGEN